MAIPQKQFTIGIDPGASTGFAVWDRRVKAITDAATLDFWTIIDRIAEYYPPESCDLIIEDASLNKPRFRHKAGTGVQDRMSRNVGQVQRESVLLIEGLRRKGYNVIAVRPQSAKWDAEQCKRYAGYDKRCSQHARDAIKLCAGVNDVRLMQLEAA